MRLYPSDVGRLPTLFGAPRWAVKEYLLAAVVRPLYAVCSPGRWLAAFIRQARMRGMIAEVRKARARRG